MRRALPWLTGALGLVLVLAGLVVFAAANRSGLADFGWSAYAPLEATTAYDSALEITYAAGTWQVLWTGGHVVGAGLVVAGVMVLAALGGWCLGRRAPGRPAAGGPTG